VITELDGWPSNGPTVSGWDDLGAVQNLRDFDDVVIDLAEPPLGRVRPNPDRPNWQIPDERSQSVWPAFDTLFDSVAVADFIAQGGRFVLLGRADFLRPSGHGFGFYGAAKTALTSILRLEFEWESAPGERYEVLAAARTAGVSEYLERLGGYETAVTWIAPWVERDERGRPIGEPPAIGFEALATTRADKAISFRLRWARTGAEAAFIPLPRRNRREAVREVLKCYLGVLLSDESPPWVAEVRVAEEDALDARDRELVAEMDLLRRRISEVATDRQSARRATELLYESGKPLELAVLAALRELGAEVEEPADPTKADGWITVRVGSRTHCGVLEIKSTESEHFGAKGMRQLGEWVQRGVKLRGTRYKPIFVGTSLIREPVERRPNPFVDDVVRTASQFDAALVRGEDLFKALMAHRRGALDRDAFWEELFKTVGRFDVQRRTR